MDVSVYNVTWNSQSTDSSQSMPVGGFDMGCNVWAENDRLYLYAAQSGAFDENNTLLKLTRLCLRPAGGEKLFSRGFCQTLHLEDGSITVSAGTEDDGVCIRIWAAAEKPELHIECESRPARRWELSAHCWRCRRREVTRAERGQCRDLDWNIGKYPGDVFTEPDTVEPGREELVFFHRNRDETVWELLVAQQRLEAVRDEIPNPLLHRTMGGLLKMPGMEYAGTRDGVYLKTDYRGYDYVSKAPVPRQEITLTLLTGCYDTAAGWERELRARAAVPAAFAATRAWWQRYFGRSYIAADEGRPGSETWRLARNYQLFRYMLGCNARGEYPTKFNGGLFTFDRDFTPDYRMWSGGGFTSQNQRLVYWGMLKCGDFDGMRPQFEYFRRLTGAARARVRHFFGFEGAFFNEQGNLFGLCTGAEYSWQHRSLLSDAFEDCPWVRLHFSSGLEFALMMLEYARYSGRKIPEYLEYIESVVEFYFNFYKTGADGKLCIFPSTALETYKGSEPLSRDDALYGCTNPMDAVAGLRCVLSELLRYLEADGGGDAAEKISRLKRYRSLCPELPAGTDGAGNKVFRPAQKYDPRPFNCELPELYPVFPYSPEGLSAEAAETGRNTYRLPYASADMALGYSWHQNGIFAARLGLLGEAEKYLKIKLGDGPFRFPAFWGPGHDWMPDHNHGGSGMIELQEMLMQCEGRTIRLLPCWDEGTDVSFRLYAPDETVVECMWKNGAPALLKVTPECRRKDVVFGPACAEHR